jgi:hypothetical protein
MISRLVIVAVLVLAAVAAADAFRQGVRERETSTETTPPGGPDLVRGVRQEFTIAPELTRVLRNGRVYLSAEQIDAAFPAPLEGASFDIAHLATAPDGTLALAIYKFPSIGPPRNGIQVWRKGELVGAFTVRPGTFGGGLGFTSDGRLVAALSPDGLRASLFEPSGKRAGVISATSW